MGFGEEPSVRLVARPLIDWAAIHQYLQEHGGEEWMSNAFGGSDGEVLAELGGRLCYRSWKPGLNPNVTRVRTDQGEYFENLLRSGHGSVLEHANYSFIFDRVSRVFTHELARHRAGIALSQESMRYVRLDDIPFWLPEWAKEDPELVQHASDLLARMEWFQSWLAKRADLDNATFSVKKAFTSFMRRFAPDGVSTAVLWTANVRALRHIIEARTAAGAEEEMRLVFGKVAVLMKNEAPHLFGDFTEGADGSWVPEWSKV